MVGSPTGFTRHLRSHLRRRGDAIPYRGVVGHGGRSRQHAGRARDDCASSWLTRRIPSGTRSFERIAFSLTISPLALSAFPSESERLGFVRDRRAGRTSIAHARERVHVALSLVTSTPALTRQRKVLQRAN